MRVGLLSSRISQLTLGSRVEGATTRAPKHGRSLSGGSHVFDGERSTAQRGRNRGQHGRREPICQLLNDTRAKSDGLRRAAALRALRAGRARGRAGAQRPMPLAYRSVCSLLP